MTKGIVYIAMGAEYERLAAATIRASLSRVPASVGVSVILNTATPAGDWAGLDRVGRIVADIPTDKNRLAKILLYKYTPYDETLYIDVDSVIQHPGIERVFDKLKDAHLIIQKHFVWDKYKKYYSIYSRAAKRFDCKLPLTVAIGGFFLFRNTPATRLFFDLWAEYWADFGAGRDMPPLACALQNSGIKYASVTAQKDGFFSFGYKANSIVVHRVAADDLQTRFNIPAHVQNKPFDKGHRDDWDQVYFEPIKNDWLRNKADIEMQDKRERKFISNYLPSIMNGGKRVLDIGAGFGQFILICRRYGNDARGIVPPLEKYADKIGIKNSDSLDYEVFARERMEKNALAIVEKDMARAVFSGEPFLPGQQFDIIVCKHAINLIFSNCFDFGGPMEKYDNRGRWIIDGGFEAAFYNFFVTVASVMAPGAVFMLAALNASNVAEYSAAAVKISGEVGFTAEIFNGGLNHRFTRAV